MSKLRVIAGTAKGKKLKMVPGDCTRPISDRVKEALFNILNVDVRESKWLDLFAGTGSVGIEALSRGAKWALFTDTSHQAIQTIQANLEHTKLKDKAQVRRIDAFELLQQPAKEQFDYIYIAPPQYAGLWRKAVSFVDHAPERLSSNGWVIAQIHPKEYESLSLHTLAEFDQRRYGNTLLVFYERLG